MVLLTVLIFVTIRLVISENSNESDLEIQNVNVEHETDKNGQVENGKNGRTYLFKASKLNGDEIYRNIMQYRERYDSQPEIRSGKRNYLRMERFKNAYSAYLIDPEWTFNALNQFVEFPEIAYDFYNKMNDDFENITSIRMIFEKDFSENNVLSFDLFSLNENEEIVDAELYIYRFAEMNETESKHQTDEIIRLYQLIDLGSINSTSENFTRNADLHKLLSVIYVSSSHSGWQVFKVENVLENWLSESDPNLGFLITATDSTDIPVELNIGRKVNQKYQPILVVYVAKKGSTSQKINGLNPKIHKKRQHETENDEFDFNFKSNRLPLSPNNRCNKQIWYISFQELGWNNFIIAPHGFMAFQCRGNCLVPTSTTVKASKTSNHGLLKHLFHSFVYVKRPCCVPDSYKNLVIMFLDRDQNVIIKNYDSMIVNSCGCR